MKGLNTVSGKGLVPWRDFLKLKSMPHFGFKKNKKCPIDKGGGTRIRPVKVYLYADPSCKKGTIH